MFPIYVAEYEFDNEDGTNRYSVVMDACDKDVRISAETSLSI
jgi:hypothetical protein